MVDMDGWCPACGYSVEPGTRFCGSCGQQFPAENGAPVPQSSTVTPQSPGAPAPGYAAPPALPPAAPPPQGSAAAWPPPPAGAPAGGGQPPAPSQGQPAVSDTLEQMLRPQGLFQQRLPSPADWQQPYQPAPGGYPQPGPYPPAPGQQPYPPAPGQAPYPPAPGQHPATGSFQQAPPPAWPQAPTGAMPAAGPPALPQGPAQPGYPPAPGQYPQGGAYQGPYGAGPQLGDPYAGGQFGPGQFGQDGMPQSEAPGGAGLLGRLSGKLPGKRPLVPVAVGGGIIIVVIVALTLSSQGGSSATAGTSATPTPTPSASASNLTQHQAATALASLLAQSGTDHSDVNAAVSYVEECKGLAGAAKTFNRAASNRDALLSKLSRLPGASALPASMISELKAGWQASATVDIDLAKWARAEGGHCKKNDTKNAHYTASLPYDSKATNGKTAFVAQWNHLARKYGLKVYQPSQI